MTPTPVLEFGNFMTSGDLFVINALVIVMLLLAAALVMLIALLVFRKKG